MVTASGLHLRLWCAVAWDEAKAADSHLIAALGLRCHELYRGERGGSSEVALVAEASVIATAFERAPSQRSRMLPTSAAAVIHGTAAPSAPPFAGQRH